MSDRSLLKRYVEWLSPRDRTRYKTLKWIAFAAASATAVGFLYLDRDGSFTKSSKGLGLTLRIADLVLILALLGSAYLERRGRKSFEAAHPDRSSSFTRDVSFDTSFWTEDERASVAQYLRREGAQAELIHGKLVADRTYESTIHRITA
jgi:hypothetical protein